MKFTAPTMDQALAKVKTSLGRDAVILHTRCFSAGGFLGFGARDIVEVTASDDVRVPARRVSAAPAATALDRAYRRTSGSSAEMYSLKTDVTALRSMVAELVRKTRSSRTDLWPEPLKSWFTRLVRRDVSEETAVTLLEPVAARLIGNPSPDPHRLRAMVLESLHNSLKTAPPLPEGSPGRPSLVALVGPTGVGKTTTIAKLAAHHALREKRRVGLITLDTYRIAAVEQLRTYARIIDCPLEVVLTPADLPAAVDRLSDCSIIFLDTAGRSQRDSMKMNDLKHFFEIRRPDQIHLVLAATAERAAIKDVLQKFSIYRPDRILLTKLDELPACGKLLDISALASEPLSYVTTGQNVPDDIENAHPARLADLVAGEASLDD